MPYKRKKPMKNRDTIINQILNLLFLTAKVNIGSKLYQS